MMVRRFEVLLPAQFNDGRDVAEVCMRCLPDTLMDVIDRFGALSFDTGPIQGSWHAMGSHYGCVGMSCAQRKPTLGSCSVGSPLVLKEERSRYAPLT